MTEEINFEWCKKHGFEKRLVNTADSITFDYGVSGEYVINYTQSMLQKRSIVIYNFKTEVYISFEYKYSESITITEKNLYNLCLAAGIEYPFIDET